MDTLNFQILWKNLLHTFSNILSRFWTTFIQILDGGLTKF